MLGCQCPILFLGHFDLDLWHILHIIGGRNPKFSVRIYLGFSECRTLFIDHLTLTSGLIYENLLSFGDIMSHRDTIHDFA